MNVTFDLAAPWFIYLNKLIALFAEDDNVTVNADNWQSGASELAIRVCVNGHDKAAAIKQLLKPEVDFGGVKVHVNVVDATPEVLSAVEIAKAAFAGNGLVYDVLSIVDKTNYTRNYVVMAPKIIRYYADNLADYKRKGTKIPEDIACEVLNDGVALYYCTADPEETHD